MSITITVGGTVLLGESTCWAKVAVGVSLWYMPFGTDIPDGPEADSLEHLYIAPFGARHFDCLLSLS